jgi:hypothetical protein
MQLTRRVLAVAMVMLAACASAGGGATGGNVAAKVQNPSVISTEEIEASSGTNAYEVIQRLRPNFLRTRGAVHGTPGATNAIETVDLVVYLNENRLGASDQLRQIAKGDIREIRYFNSSEATTKWGTGHSAGAIQVVSR